MYSIIVEFGIQSAPRAPQRLGSYLRVARHHDLELLVTARTAKLRTLELNSD